jgi:putative sterol carrier protein
VIVGQAAVIHKGEKQMANVAEIFDNMCDNFKADKAGDMNAVIQFDLSGDDGGQWYVAIDNGSCNVNKGTTSDPTSTIRMSASDYADMVSGDLNPMSAFMSGKIKVEGDLNTVMKFQQIMGM